MTYISFHNFNTAHIAHNCRSLSSISEPEQWGFISRVFIVLCWSYEEWCDEVKPSLSPKLLTLRTNTRTLHIWFPGQAWALFPIRQMYGTYELIRFISFCKYKLSLQQTCQRTSMWLSLKSYHTICQRKCQSLLECIHNHLVLIWYKGKVHQTAVLSTFLQKSVIVMISTRLPLRALFFTTF